mmetsp:Transcript_47076/g.93210  ORF Transcript_47076/g.93210 Transcript_47076/m.93210 type:complete len:130 (+) Transcript_47076:2134-2523(+)
MIDLDPQGAQASTSTAEEASTGTRLPHRRQALRTLASYRRRHAEILFGKYLAVRFKESANGSANKNIHQQGRRGQGSDDDDGGCSGGGSIVKLHWLHEGGAVTAFSGKEEPSQVLNPLSSNQKEHGGRI